MNDDEFDLFFIQLLKNILIELKESYEYEKKYSLKEYKEITDNLENDIDIFNGIISKIKTIDDFAEYDDDIIDRVYENIFDFASNFIIHPDTAEKDTEEYKNIEEILYMFVDEDE